MATQFDTFPFPRFQPLANLTWAQCFAMNGNEIMAAFVQPLRSVSGDRPQMRNLATLLFAMMDTASTINNHAQASNSVAVEQNHRDRTGTRLSLTIQELPTEVRNDYNLGRFRWSPTGTRVGLYCSTVYDVLAACMSEAAYHPAHLEIRTKDNYYVILATLYKYWCMRMLSGKDPARRPTMTSIFCHDSVIVLGATLADPPHLPHAKEILRLARYHDMLARGRTVDGVRRVMDLNRSKHMVGGQDYGNCAETWLFAMLCSIPEAHLHRAFGVALRAPGSGNLWPNVDVGVYDAGYERTRCPNQREPYAPMCGNCERLAKQVVREGRPSDKVVENFSVEKWQL